ncbi:uncharacterized protein LOC135395824 [Ornithodoros turicata]|uniref:uncharacterized protein LOC135395824 n=1 Tax=Ornithodoros turicata TaxID=34597 RepID=UPI00313A3B00
MDRNPTSAGQFPDQGSPLPAPSLPVQAVSIKIPPFWPADPVLWFANTEAQFALRGITAQLTKFYHVVGALGPSEARGGTLRDVITVPPAENPYDALKSALTRRTTASKQERLRQLLTAEVLGDRKPSQLLRRMQQLLSDTASALEEYIMRELFLQRLPNTVLMILTTSSSISLEALAEMADKMMDIAPPAILAVSPPPVPLPSSSELQVLRDEVARLSDLVISNLRFSQSPCPRRRSPRRYSRRRSQPPRSQSANPDVCWYHQTYGDRARKCLPPCSRQGNASVSN